MTWYYESGGQQQGPVSDSELDRLLSEGKINLDTLVWREGQAGWAPLRAARPTGGVSPAAPPISAATGPEDIGLEVTRPAAPRPPSGGASDVPQPGYIRCTATGRYFPPSEIIYIEGKPYSAGAKPQVVASLQAGTGLPSLGDSTGRNGPAWEHRKELGLVKALWETIKAVLTNPGDTFTRMKREGGLWEPLLFVLITGSIGGAITTILMSVFNLSMPMMAGAGSAGGSPPPAAMAGIVGGQLLCSLIMLPIQIGIGAFFGAGILHLCLMMLGGAKQPFETTFRAYVYSSGSGAALQVVPILGALVGSLWGLVASCIAIAKTHEIPTGKAVLAVLLPMIVCCGALIIIFVAAAGLGFAGAVHNR
jgi:hypothetical protein